MALKREKDRLVHQLKQQVGPPAWKVCFAGLGALGASSGVSHSSLSWSVLWLRQLKPGRIKMGQTGARTQFDCFSVLMVHVAGLTWFAISAVFLSFILASCPQK